MINKKINRLITSACIHANAQTASRGRCKQGKLLLTIIDLNIKIIYNPLKKVIN